MLAEIVLLAGTTKVTVRDIPECFADAIRPCKPEDGEHSIAWHAVANEYEKAVEAAVLHGELIPRNPLTLQPSPGAMGEQLMRSFVTVEDLREFARQFDLGVRVEVDIQPYLKLQQWTLIEAACLLSGISPVAEQDFDKDISTGGEPAKVYRILKDAIKLEQIQSWSGGGVMHRKRVLPEEAVSWAKLHGYEIPKALEGLVFMVRHTNGHSHMNKGTYEDYQTDLAERRARGRYTLEEAAQTIEAETGEHAATMLKKLMAAAKSHDLPVYWPGKDALYLYGPGHASVVREDIEEARCIDLNTWLEKNEHLIFEKWQFPIPSADTPTDSAPKALSRKAILAANWPLHGKFNQQSLARALSDVPQWLDVARIYRGKAGGISSTWNPAILAECLANKGYAKRPALTEFISRHFAKWFPEWEQAQQYPED